MLPTNFQPDTPAASPKQTPWWQRRWKLTVAVGVVKTLGTPIEEGFLVVGEDTGEWIHLAAEQ